MVQHGISVFIFYLSCDGFLQAYPPIFHETETHKVSHMNETGYILKEILFLLIQVSLCLLAFFRFGKRLLAPPVIFPFLWSIILFLHLILGNSLLSELYPLTNSTFLIITLGSACFVTGGLMPLSIWKGQPYTPEKNIESEHPSTT